MSHSFPTLRSSDLLAASFLLPSSGTLLSTAVPSLTASSRMIIESLTDPGWTSTASSLVVDLPAVSPPPQAARAIRESDARYRSEEHTSELQSLMRNSYAVFYLKT